MRTGLLFFAGLGVGVLFCNQTPLFQPIVEAKQTNVVVTTSKMDLETAFYEKTLGFKVFYHDKTSTFLKTGSANLVFVRSPSSSAETKRICLDVGVPSVPDAAKKLKAAGTKIDDADPAVLKLNDPDGNLIEIVKG